MTVPERRGRVGRPPAAGRRLGTASVHELRAELARAVAAQDTTTCSRLHELIAGVLAAQGDFTAAYRELRTAIDLERSRADRPDPQLVAEIARLRRETAEAKNLSMRDSLTESFNRRFLDQELRQLAGARGAAVPGVLALADLDLFKLVNDRFGHPLGDLVLQRVVELLQVDLPPGAFCARYGGEEFVLALPGLDEAGAVALCEAARARVERHEWGEVADGLRVTVSIGLAGPWCADGTQLLDRADGLLYAAKSSGRNAVAHRGGPGEALQLAGAAGRRRVQVDAARPRADRSCRAQPTMPV